MMDMFLAGSLENRRVEKDLLQKNTATMQARKLYVA
jgi:hypothetical protein